MKQAGRGLAYAIVTAVVLWVVLDIPPVYGSGVQRIYVGALILAAVAAVTFLLALAFNVFGWSDAGKEGFQAAVTNLAIGAASLAIVGLVAIQLVPAVDDKPNIPVQAGGLIAILVVAGVFLFGETAPQISWSKLPLITTLAAMVLVVAYGAAIIYMLTNASVDEKIWARYLVIFTAVQGVGLAAVGALLGTQVKQAEVNEAKADVKDALDSADKTSQLSGSSAMGGRPSTDQVARAEARLGELRAKYQ